MFSSIERVFVGSHGWCGLHINPDNIAHPDLSAEKKEKKKEKKKKNRQTALGDRDIESGTGTSTPTTQPDVPLGELGLIPDSFRIEF